MAEKLLTIREVANILNVTEKEVVDLAESGKIPAYKVAGVYLRFKPEQIEDFQNKNAVYQSNKEVKYAIGEKLRDFLVYNDFYIFSALTIALIIFFIFKGI